MVNLIKKKIKEIIDNISIFVKQNIIKILFSLGLFIFLEIIKSFPYINIIPNVDFLIVGLTLLFTVFLFRYILPNKAIVLVTLVFFIVAAFTTIVELKDIAEMLGFIIFVLLFIAVASQILQDREKLKEIDIIEK